MTWLTIATVTTAALLVGFIAGIAAERARASESLWIEHERWAEEIAYLRRILGAAMDKLKEHEDEDNWWKHGE